MRAPDLQLGVEVGATSTDAVVIDAGHHLLSKAKVPTTPYVHAGVADAIRLVVAHPLVAPRRITRAMLGTGHAMSGALDRHAVRRVAVVRIGRPLTLAVPPLATWSPELRRAVSVGEAVIGGGAEYDGRAVAPLDEQALARFLAAVAERVEAVAVSAVFSRVAPEHELAAAEVVRRELGAIPVSLSHDIGSLGLLERENATVLNAALVGAAEDLAAALASILAAERIEAEPFFAQNDGTVMAPERALRFPVLMLGSGPACSMRGAAYLSGVDQGVVADVGAAATVVGMLVNGFPRLASLPTEVAGVRIDCRMPEIFSLPLGLGSVVGLDDDPPTIGPLSVGRDLTERALVFGGDVPTLADALVAGGRAAFGSRALSGDQRRVLSRALAVVDELLVEAVGGAVAAVPGSPLVVVGGGSMLVPDGLDGVVEVIRPADGDAANAIGVATAPVSGEADRICPNRQDSRARALEEARVAAVASAVHAGADPDRVAVVEVEEIPLSYLVDPAIRIRVKVSGPRS